MKKIMIPIMMIILLTGCSTEYNLEFKDGKFSDSVKIGEFNSDDVSDFDTLEPIASFKDYEIKYYDFNYKNNYLTLNHKYSYSEYRVSSALKDCFNLSAIVQDDKHYYIETSGEFKCLHYSNYTNENVKVNFKTDLEVESANADTIVDDVYTWIFNENNYKNKTIDISLLKKEEDNNHPIKNNTKPKTTIEEDTITYFIIVIIVSIVIAIIYGIFKKYSNSKNKIPK